MMEYQKKNETDCAPERRPGGESSCDCDWQQKDDLDGRQVRPSI